MSGIRAQTTTWQNAGTSTWSTGANWDNGVPDASSTATINNGGTANLDSTGAADFLIVGDPSGSGSFTITGGALTVGTDSNIGNGGTGDATVNSGSWSSGGTLYVGFFRTGSLTILGGTVSAPTIRLAFLSNSTGTLNLDGGVLAAGQIIKGSGTGGGHINFDGGTLQATAGQTAFLSGFSTGNVQIAAGGANIDSNGNNIGLTNVLQGAGGLTKLGAGSLIISANNTYAGTTTVSTGTLQFGTGAAAGSVAGDIANNSALVFNRSGTATYAGNISGTGSVTQTGPGTMVLSGTQSYTGATTVSAGTLSINGSTAAASAVTVNAGGTLSGTGTVGGAVTVASGGAIAPGNSPGTLSLSGGASLNGGSALNFRLTEAAQDKLVLVGNGANTLAGPGSGTITINLIDTDSSVALNTSYSLVSVVGSFATITNWNLSSFALNSPAEWGSSFLSMSGNDLMVTIIPEPGDYVALAGASVLGLVWLRRRRPRA